MTTLNKYRVWVTPDLSDLDIGFEMYIEAKSFQDAKDQLVIAIEYFSNTRLEYQLFNYPETIDDMLFYRPTLQLNESEN